MDEQTAKAAALLELTVDITQIDKATGRIKQVTSDRFWRLGLYFDADTIAVPGKFDDAIHRFDLSDNGCRLVEERERAIPAAPKVAEVKAECARRLAFTDWYITRAADPSDGRSMPDDIAERRTALRAACAALIATDPIPADYTDSKYWV